MAKPEKSSTETGVGGSLFDVFNTRTYTLDDDVLRKILAIWVQDPTFLTKYRRFCKSIFFAQDEFYLVAEQLLKHFDKNGGPPDEVMLIQRLRLYAKMGKQKIDLASTVKLARAIYAENIRGSKATLTEWVIEFGKIEQTKIAFRRGVEQLKEGKYSDIQATMSQLFDFYHVGEFDDIDAGFVEESLLQDIAGRRVRAKDRVPFGVPAIDRYLGGGLGLGQLYVIAGGTGVGKTTAALRACRGAVHACEPAIMFSTEVQRPRLVDKYHAAVTGIPTGLAMIEHEETIIRKMKKYLEKRQRLFHIAWMEPYTKTMADIKEYLRYLRERQNFFPKLIVIDSPDLLRPTERHLKPHDALAEIYTSIFAMTGRDNVATLVTTDVKQAARDNLLIGVTDIGGSYEKAKKADGVFGLGRDKERMQLDENGCFKIWFNMDKLRTDGSSGMVLEIEVAPHLARWTGVSTVGPEKMRAALGLKSQEEKGLKKGQKTQASHY